MKGLIFTALVAFFLCAGTVAGEDAYYDVPLDSLPVTEGELPAIARRRRFQALLRVRLDGEGKAYLRTSSPGRGPLDRWDTMRDDQTSLAIRAPAGREVTGRLYLPPDAHDSVVRVAFKVTPSMASEAARQLFYWAKERHYRALLRRGIPGAAWFRHQAQAAGAELGDAAPVAERPELPWRPTREGELEDTYAVFTGGRAMSENMQLDRLPRPADAGEETVDVSSLPGIDVAEMDWAPLIEGLEPERDPLASLVPADQHALFFSSFDDFVTTLDEAKAHGTPVLRLLDVRSEDAQTHMRYEGQLCLRADALSRLFGPQLVRSVAVTGSDPFMRTGTDVALLFEARDPVALRALLEARVAANARPDAEAKPVSGTVLSIPYTGFRSPSRAVCSYVASVGSAVVVTNSLGQLQRLASATQGDLLPLASLPEYTFFRARYPRRDPKETALLIVPDGAIRRWCGPRWRIGASRRTRAVAVMSELQAGHLNELVSGQATEVALETDLPVPGGGDLSLGPAGVTSSLYGNLAFLTPISEIAIEKVTQAEANAYRAWRSRYHRNWRQYFDPIAVCFSVSPNVLAADVTVMPLIEGSDYREVVELTEGVQIAPDAADPHEGTLLHFAMAINRHSEPVREIAGFAAMMAPGMEMDPLGWLGESVALYVEQSPFWDELRKNADDADSFLEDNLAKLPIAAQAEVKDSMKLTAFLTVLRGFVQMSAPGMQIWETRTHNEQPYVRVSPSKAARDNWAGQMVVCYAPLPEALIVTLSEKALQDALDRRAARLNAAEEGQPLPRTGKPWLGSSMCLQVERHFLDVLRDIMDEEFRTTMQRRSWDNIPILNEWKVLFPDRDPVAVHEALWKTRLVCPGGGTYVWDDDSETMASTAYGHPSSPKHGPDWPAALLEVVSGNMGVTFEHQGLRARAVIGRQPQEQTP